MLLERTALKWISVKAHPWDCCFLFFRSRIVDGKENNQKVLSAKLFVRMNPDKSISLLRNNITSGRLGSLKLYRFQINLQVWFLCITFLSFFFKLYDFIIAIPFEDIVSMKCNILIFTIFF